MADRAKEISNRGAEAKILSNTEQERQARLVRDALEDDQVREALKCLHHDQHGRRQ
jgi:hypothetical protein